MTKHLRSLRKHNIIRTVLFLHLSITFKVPCAITTYPSCVRQCLPFLSYLTFRFDRAISVHFLTFRLLSFADTNVRSGVDPELLTLTLDGPNANVLEGGGFSERRTVGMYDN